MKNCLNMKENLDEILNHANGYKDSMSLVFPTKDLLDSNGCGGTKDSLACETKVRNEFREAQKLDDSVFFEDISRSNKHETRASPPKDDMHEGLSNFTSCKRNGNTFACDSEDRDHPWGIPEYEGSMIVVYTDDKEKGAIVSNATDTHLYTDKGVVECKLPESTICYKESNYNIMKDICMDEGVPLMDKIVTENRKDDQPDSSKNTREGVDSELVSAGESKASSVESTFKISVDHHTTKEDEDIKSLVSKGLNPLSEDNMSKDEDTKSLVSKGLNPFSEDNTSNDADKDSYLEDVMKIFGSKCTTTAKDTNISEKESDIRNSKESNSDADQSAQKHDQMPSSIAAFNSVAKTVKNLSEHSLTLEAVSSQKDESSDSFPAASQVHFANNVDPINSGVHGQSLDPQNVANHEDKNSGNLPLGVHFSDGEASFSTAGPASGLITYSGPISQSGNVSLRSDSSTTSARSFAFPVLQSEWNSSPVRMAQAERRKHRGWRKSLLCCRF